MKKILAILVIVFLLLISMLTGCGQKFVPDTSPEYKFETDYNLSYSFLGDSSHMVETEEGYYYVTVDDYIRFIDKKTMQDVFLCNKPECTHTEKDSAICNAHLGSGSRQQLFQYKGDLYCLLSESKYGSTDIRDVYLSKISKDGTSREKIWGVNWKGTSGFFQFGVLHRGVYYFYVSTGENMGLYAYDLELNKCKHIYSADILGTKLTPVGNYLYWEHSWGETEEALQMKVMKYEISTGDISEISDCWKIFTAGDRVFFGGHDLKTRCEVLSSSKRDGTGLQRDQLRFQGVEYGDKNFIYSYPYREGDTVIELYDVNTFDLVAEIDISVQQKEYQAYRMMPGNENVLFLTNIQGYPILYAYKSAIGTPDFQWYEVEKIN